MEGEGGREGKKEEENAQVDQPATAEKAQSPPAEPAEDEDMDLD